MRRSAMSATLCSTSTCMRWRRRRPWPGPPKGNIADGWKRHLALPIAVTTTELARSMPGNVPPATDIKRWTPLQKATVLDAVRFGKVTLEDACDQYRLTMEELASWQATMDHQGIAGLRIRRQAERRSERRATLEDVALALVNGTVPVACKI